MDKVLTRKLFKNVYLQSVSKNILRFKEGGLASLRAKHYQTGGLSEGERTAMLLAPIATQLLTGTRQPGQSQLGAVASNIGAAIPQVVKTRLDIDKAETERLDQLAKLEKIKGEPEKLKREDEKEFRTMYSTSPIVKSFNESQTNINKVIEGASRDDPAGDYGVIFGFLKILDPGSTVREGEFATVENSRGVSESVRALYNKVKEGDRLSPEQRRQFTEGAINGFQTQQASLDTYREQIGDIAKKKGIDQENIFIDSDLRPRKITDKEGKEIAAPKGTKLTTFTSEKVLDEKGNPVVDSYYIFQTPDGSTIKQKYKTTPLAFAPKGQAKSVTEKRYNKPAPKEEQSKQKIYSIDDLKKMTGEK
jgi:hypothetical protein